MILTCKNVKDSASKVKLVFNLAWTLKIQLEKKRLKYAVFREYQL